MTFFKKFSPFKIPTRKKLHFHSDRMKSVSECDDINIALGPTEYSFIRGEWVLSSRLGDARDGYEILQQQNQDLKEENNFLRLKTDILLDMVTNIKTESQMKEREINHLRYELFSKKQKRM